MENMFNKKAKRSGAEDDRFHRNWVNTCFRKAKADYITDQLAFTEGNNV